MLRIIILLGLALAGCQQKSDGGAALQRKVVNPEQAEYNQALVIPEDFNLPEPQQEAPEDSDTEETFVPEEAELELLVPTLELQPVAPLIDVEIAIEDNVELPNLDLSSVVNPASESEIIDEIANQEE